MKSAKTNLVKSLLPLFFIFVSLSSIAQNCPGGGVDFSSAIAFDPSWVYGCNTGTSCNGGINFSNAISCQPTIALDACAPAPSCTNAAQNASNVWFKFYALGPSVTISCFQNSSFVIGIQAFSGGPACGSLMQIGCAVAGGPSSGVQLALTGLKPGQLYYFRIYGSSTPISQRTGIYCFCGTIGLDNVILPETLASFKGYTAGDNVELQWSTFPAAECQYFEVQRSTHDSSFTTIGRVDRSASASYSYSDQPDPADTLFYRLKIYSNQNNYTYSSVVPIKRSTDDRLRLFFDGSSKELQITVQHATPVAIINAAGVVMKTLELAPGKNYIPVTNFAAGIYILHDRSSNSNRRFFVFN